MNIAAVGYGLALLLAPILALVARLAASRRTREIRETHAEFEKLNDELVALTARVEALPSASPSVASMPVAEPNSLSAVRIKVRGAKWDYELYSGSAEIEIRPDNEERITQGWFETYSREIQVAEGTPVRGDEGDWMAMLREATPRHWC